MQYLCKLSSICRHIVISHYIYLQCGNYSTPHLNRKSVTFSQLENERCCALQEPVGSLGEGPGTLALFRLPAQIRFWRIQSVSRLIFESQDSNKKKKHMKSIFCKSDPNHTLRWFEMRFRSDFSLVAQIGFQSVFCVTCAMTHDENV